MHITTSGAARSAETSLCKDDVIKTKVDEKVIETKVDEERKAKETQNITVLKALNAMQGKLAMGKRVLVGVLGVFGGLVVGGEVCMRKSWRKCKFSEVHAYTCSDCQHYAHHHELIPYAATKKTCPIVSSARAGGFDDNDRSFLTLKEWKDLETNLKDNFLRLKDEKSACESERMQLLLSHMPVDKEKV